MPKFTIEEEDHYYKLQQDGRTVAVLSDCEEPVAKRIAMNLNRAASTFSDINAIITDLRQQRDELLAALREVKQNLDNATAWSDHDSDAIVLAELCIERALDKAEGGQP